MSTLADSIDPRFTTRERQPGLDLLRAVAIVLVVIYHAGLLGFALPSDLHRFGWIGVDLFFVLSGYLISGPLIATLQRGHKIDFPRFYTRRALRILPAYLTVVAIYFIWPAAREWPNISPLWKFLLSVQNIDLRPGTAFSHAWSLAVEDQFYLLLPAFLVFSKRWRIWGMIFPAIVVLGGLGLRAFLAQALHLTDPNVSYQVYMTWIYYPTWTRLDPLVFGVLLAAIEQCRKSWWQRLLDHATWLWVPGLAAIAVALPMGEGDLTMAGCIWQFPLIAFGMAALLICTVSPRLPFRRLKVPGAELLASLAYSVYLSHKLVIHLVKQGCVALQILPPSWEALLVLQLAIYGTGAALFFAVERPFLQLRHHLAGPAAS